MYGFWLLLFTSKSFSLVTPFNVDNQIALKFGKAVTFTAGEAQINHVFHTRGTNNALFAKSAFTFLF